MSDTMTIEEHKRRLEEAQRRAYDKGFQDGISYVQDGRNTSPLTPEIIADARKLWILGERPSKDWEGDDTRMVHPILGSVIARETELRVNGQLWRTAPRHVTLYEHDDIMRAGIGALALEIAIVRALVPQLAELSDVAMGTMKSLRDGHCYSDIHTALFNLAQSLRAHPAANREVMKRRFGT